MPESSRLTSSMLEANPTTQEGSTSCKGKLSWKVMKKGSFTLKNIRAFTGIHKQSQAITSNRQGAEVLKVLASSSAAAPMKTKSTTKQHFLKLVQEPQEPPSPPGPKYSWSLLQSSWQVKLSPLIISHWHQASDAQILSGLERLCILLRAVGFWGTCTLLEGLSDPGILSSNIFSGDTEEPLFFFGNC